MKSTILNSVLLFLVALLPFAFADSYDVTSVSTVYSTKTVYAVHTEIKTGTPPASSSSSSSAYYPISYGTAIASSQVYSTGSASAYYPTGTAAGTPTTKALPTFTGAASQLNVNALVAAIAAGAGYLAL